MQASSLSILVDEKRVNDLLKQKTGAKAFLRSACNLVVFIGFITLFTYLALGEPLSVHRSFQTYLKHRFDTGAAVRLSEVNDIAGFYHYWNRSLIPGLYSNSTRQYTFPGAPIPKLLKLDGDKANNRLFGLLRVRMQKVISGSGCSVQDTYSGKFSTCYGDLTKETDDRKAFGPVEVIGGPMFKYEETEEAADTIGWLSVYAPGGFMEAMSGNYSASLELMDQLMVNGWLGPASRVVWFEFTIYNLNLGLYAVCRIMFEISPVGGWLKSFDVDILDERHLAPLGDGGIMAWVLLIMEATIVVLVFRYLLEEASEFIGCAPGKRRMDVSRLRIKWGYFTDGWNMLDWANLILMIYVFILRIQVWMLGSYVLVVGTNMTHKDYLSLHDAVEGVKHIRELTAFNAVLTWFKAVKYITILPYIGTFMETLSASWKYLVGWTAIFLTSFMGFCLSYCTAFGESITDFRTLPRTFVFLIRAFVGNADMRLVYDANPVIGSALILMFVVSMVFINMNLLYAIIISYMSDARAVQEVAEAKEWAKFMDKVYGFGNTVARGLQLQARFRSCFPGLWSRMKTWEKNRMELEKKRDARVAMRLKMQMPHEDIEGVMGSASPSYGRRKKRMYKQEAELDSIDIESNKADTDSEPDLGPLRFKEQLETKHDHHDDHHFHHDDHDHHLSIEDAHHDKENHHHHNHHHHHHHDHHHHHGDHHHHDHHHHDHHHHHHDHHHHHGFGADHHQDQADRDEEAKELVFKATEHVVWTITERCHGARNLVVGEMGEARQVLQGIGNVLEVLGRRARSLEAQQEQVLPPEVIARVRQKAEEEEDY